MYRDAKFFALELAPVAGPVVNEGVVSYLGLSMLPVGAMLPSASGDVEQDAAPAADVGSRFAAFMALSCSKVLSLVVLHGKYTEGSHFLGLL